MSDMKLIMEGWRQHLQEGENRQRILSYLAENNIVLTEEQIEEAMPKWLKKLGAGAALTATLAGVPSVASAAPGGAQDTDTQTVQVDAEDASESDDFNAALGLLKAYIDSKGSTKEKMDLEFKLMNVQKALDKAADGDSSMLNSLGSGDAGFLDSVMGKINKFKTQDLELYNSYKDAGSKINIR